ncbi:ATP-binding protein [Sulfurimonas sp. HSL3-7]|uniref:ATP-binding protein n=1 Tax=Sulfonitrofixus jiaomeiensis TaxID=3131938 RepID=UPI0031F91449
MSFILSNVHNDLDGYNQLIKLYDKYKDDFFENIEIELTQWFDANLCAVLGGILDKIENGGINDIVFISIKNDIQTILQKNGFLAFYGYDKIYDTYHSTIEYKKLKPSDSRYFNQYLEDDLLKRSGLPKMSDAVHEKISESIQEMFVNAQIHSETEFIYTCGQYFHMQDKINFTIVDTGIGFAKRIEKNLKEVITSKDAIKWAMIDGNTTKQGVSGGLGLALLQEFITQNKGKIQIISGNALYELSNGSETIQELDSFFQGSVISMTFKTDDNKTYRLLSEVEEIDINDIF